MKNPRAILVLLLALRLILGLAYSALNPLGEAPDEADHYAYAAYIGREGRLPVGPEMTQAKHPPLYHILAAGAARLAGAEPDFGFLRSNPDVGVTAGAVAPNFFIHTTLEKWPWRGGSLAMHMGRFVSLAAALVLTAATYALARALWPFRPEVALGAAAFAAFLPESLFIGGAMNNDMLAAMWAALALWMALRTGAPSAGLSGLLLGLAFVTKASTVALAPIIALVVFSAALREKPLDPAGLPPPRARARVAVAVGRTVLAGLATAAAAAPWLWRNWRLYGDLAGWPVVLATIDGRQGPLDPAALADLAQGWLYSFWGKFGGAGHLALPMPFYIVWFVLLAASAAGWLVWSILRVRQAGLLRGADCRGLLVLLGAPLCTATGVVSYSRVALGTDQGRLLFPALAPLALLITGGLFAWLPRRWVSRGLAGWIILMVAIGIGALLFGIVGPYAAPAPPGPGEMAQAMPVDRDFGQELQLVALSWHPEETALTLYWRVQKPVADDLRTALRLVAPDGGLLWERKRSPGAGRFSTDRWPAGRLVSDTYSLPADLARRAERLELGVYSFPANTWLPPSGGAPDESFLILPRVQS